MKQIIRLNVPESLKNAVKDDNFHVIYNETPQELEIFLTGVIGDEFSESDAGSIAKVLSRNRGKPVTMRVNSPGGLAFDGLAIFNAIASHDAPTVGIIEGLAASAASLAVIGCDTVKMHANAVYQIHQGLSFAYGHIAELQDAITWLESFNAAAVDTYAAKTGKPPKEIAAALLGSHGDGTKYSAAEALAMGFIDEVIPLGKQKTKSAKNEEQQRMTAQLRYRAANVKLRFLK